MATKDKLLLRALRGEVLERPPVWMMRQAGRYLPEYRETRAKAGSFLDLCYSPELACEVTLQPIRRYGFDASILFADILLIPQALGQRLWFAEGEGPRLEPVDDISRLKRLDPGRIHETLEPVYETVRLLRAGLPPETALIGFAGAPWTVATYMVAGRGTSDQAPARLWAYREPDVFQELIDLISEATIDYLARQIEAGAEVVQLFDTWAQTLPEGEFRRWCIAPTARIVAALKERFPEVPVIGFPRGAGALYPAYVAETGVDAVSLDTGMPADWARDHIQSKVTVQGNLDPLLVVAGGDAMRQQVTRLLDCLGQGPYVFNLGHGLVPQTPPEHVGEIVAMVKNWRRT